MDQSRRPTILVSAGEVSGDRIGAPVVEAIRRRLPHPCDVFGAGGPRLAGAGVEIRHSISALAVTGATEALGRTASGLQMLADLGAQIRRRRPRLGLLIDYPGLNLRLAALLRWYGVPVLQYVAPQRWAWLPSRTAALRGLLDRVAVTLPFEEAWFRRRGVPATFVGNPVRDLFEPLGADQAREQLGLPEDPAGSVVALLPGSRDNEIKRHLPAMAASLRWLPAELRPVVAVSDARAAALCSALAPALPQARPEVALGAARAGLCASGTATLEAAVAGVPVVVCYRLSRGSFCLARRLVRVPHVALPNLILGAPLLPELLQDEVTPRRLAQELLRLLDPCVGAHARRQLRRVTAALGPPGVAERVAAIGLQLMGG